MAGCYRKFITIFLRIVRPLNDLLVGNSRKSKSSRPKFKLDGTNQNTFNTIVEKLTHAPVFAYADYSKPFKVHTDASDSGLGAVLYQDHDR